MSGTFIPSQRERSGTGRRDALSAGDTAHPVAVNVNDNVNDNDNDYVNDYVNDDVDVDVQRLRSTRPAPRNPRASRPPAMAVYSSHGFLVGGASLAAAARAGA